MNCSVAVPVTPSSAVTVTATFPDPSRDKTNTAGPATLTRAAVAHESRWEISAETTLGLATETE